MPRTLLHADQTQQDEFIEPNEFLENPPYAWEFANASQREAATGFDLVMVGWLARQLDDNSLWMLTGINPTRWRNTAIATDVLLTNDGGIVYDSHGELVLRG